MFYMETFCNGLQTRHSVVAKTWTVPEEQDGHTEVAGIRLQDADEMERQESHAETDEIEVDDFHDETELQAPHSANSKFEYSVRENIASSDVEMTASELPRQYYSAPHAVVSWF